MFLDDLRVNERFNYADPLAFSAAVQSFKINCSRRAAALRSPLTKQLCNFYGFTSARSQVGRKVWHPGRSPYRAIIADKSGMERRKGEI